MSVTILPYFLWKDRVMADIDSALKLGHRDGHSRNRGTALSLYWVGACFRNVLLLYFFKAVLKYLKKAQGDH